MPAPLLKLSEPQSGGNLYPLGSPVRPARLPWPSSPWHAAQVCAKTLAPANGRSRQFGHLPRTAPQGFRADRPVAGEEFDVGDESLHLICAERQRTGGEGSV